MLARAFNTFARLLRDTPIEMPIGAVLAGTIAGYAAFSSEAAKQGQIPLAFSELGHNELYVEKIGGGKINALSRYYASLNDTLMQVFEANNIARNTWAFEPFYKTFAYELEKKIDRSMRIHTQIPEHAATLPGYAGETLGMLDALARARADLPPIVKALDNAWDERHTDVEKTVEYTVTVCDDKGRNCKEEKRTRQEYDYTIHRYFYDRAQGRRAVALMQAFAATYPELKVSEKLLVAPVTNAENEWAIRESRRRMPGYKPPTQDEYLRYAATWATGSNYFVLTPKIEKTQPELHAAGASWAAAEPRARDHRYTSTSHSDSGPREYRVAKSTHTAAARQEQQLGRLIDGLRAVQTGIGPLSGKMRVYVDAALHGGPGNPRRLAREILAESRDMYVKNYAGGFDVYPASWLKATLLTLLGGAVGGGLGFGWDAWGNRRRGRQPSLGRPKFSR